MGKPLHILLLTHAEADPSLFLPCLQEAGYDPTLIPASTPTAYQNLLRQQPWDAVVWHDFPLDVPSALEILQRVTLHTPFIVITEQVQASVDAVRLGAAAASKELLAAVLEREFLYRSEKMQHEALSSYVAERTSQFDRAKEQVEAVLNSSSEAIVLTKTDGTIRQTNPAFDALFGYEIDETFGWPLAQILKPEQVGPFMAVFQAVIRGKLSRTLEVTARRKDGTFFDAEVGLSVIVDQDDEASRVVCSFHDISKHKEIEETLRLALEHERELSELKTRFITMVSHEFRTPLATILVTVDSLRSYVDRMTEAQRNSKFVKIQAQIKHMTTLLEEVLELSRDHAVEALTLEEVNLDALCQEIVDQFHAAAPDHHFLYLSVGDCTCVRLDPQLIRQTITALLSNAVKFSPRGGEVHIRLDCAENPIVLQVLDEGIGIPEADQKHVFQAFHRAKNVDTIPGTGLSLALVKQAVTRHRGGITFESKPGVGTTFTVTLPKDGSYDQNSGD